MTTTPTEGANAWVISSPGCAARSATTTTSSTWARQWPAPDVAPANDNQPTHREGHEMTDPMTAAVEAAAKHLYDRRYAMSRTAMSPWGGLYPHQIEYEMAAAQRLIDVIDPPTVLALLAEIERLTAESDDLRGEVEHWKAHAQEAGEGFSRVCKDAARLAARNTVLIAERDALRVKVERVRVLVEGGSFYMAKEIFEALDTEATP